MHQALQRIAAIAQSGLAFTNDTYDRERYTELQQIVSELLADSPEQASGIYERLRAEQGYATPKIDVRALVLRENKLLFVKEKHDGCWSIPGGFCDVGLSAKENVEKEVREETGLAVEAVRLLSVSDNRKHDYKRTLFHFYKFYFLCTYRSGTIQLNEEVTDVQWFPIDALPEPLSHGRNTRTQLERLLQLAMDEQYTHFDRTGGE